MGKQHKKKAKRAAAREPLAKSTEKLEQEKAMAEAVSARAPKLLKGLASSDPGMRSASCTAVVAMLADDRGAAKMLQHLVKNGVLQVLMACMSDRVQEVRLHAVGAVRNITVVGGAEACALLLRQGVLTPLLPLIPATLSKVGGGAADGSGAGGGGGGGGGGAATVVSSARVADREALLLLEQALVLATNLCEFSEATVASIMTTPGLVPAVLGCTQCEAAGDAAAGGGGVGGGVGGGIPLPEGAGVVGAAAQLLHVLSEGNDQFAAGVLSSQAAVAHLLGTARRPDVGLTARVHVAAVLHATLQLGGAAAAAPGVADALLPALIDPVVAALKTDCAALLAACAECAAKATAVEEAEVAAAAAAAKQPKQRRPAAAAAGGGAAAAAMADADDDDEETVEDSGVEKATPEEQALLLWQTHFSSLLVALELVANACTTDEGGGGADDEGWETDDEEGMERAAASGLGIAAPAFAGGGAALGGSGEAVDGERTMLALLSAGVPAAVLLVLQQLQQQLDGAQASGILPKQLSDLHNAHHMACVGLGNLLQNGPIAALGGSLQQVFDTMSALSMSSVQKQGPPFFSESAALPSQSASITNAVRATALRAAESQLPLAASVEQLGWLAHICVAGAGPQCLCEATRQGAATILGALGQLPHDADTNMRLGAALAGCLDDSSLPVLVEAVNAIIDVYSKDELHAMFVALKFPELLPQSLKHITAKVRRSRARSLARCCATALARRARASVDCPCSPPSATHRVSPCPRRLFFAACSAQVRELKGKADRDEIAYITEIKLNLSRFIKYKKQ